MVRRVQKWGNSLALRIPKVIASEIGLGPETAVQLSLIKGKLIVEPIPEQTATLDELLNKVTKDNLHAEIDTGSAVGNEIW